MANFYSKILKVSKLYENEKENRGQVLFFVSTPFFFYPLETPFRQNLLDFHAVGSELGLVHVLRHATAVVPLWARWQGLCGKGTYLSCLVLDNVVI